MQDDRQQFIQERQARVKSMSADPEVAATNIALMAASDKHGYSYMWDWLGAPIIQTPADVVVLQEIVWSTRPDVIIETGLARGGSAILHSSLMRLIGNSGTVIAVDIDIRPHNRDTVESHPFSDSIHLIEGSSVDPAVLSKVRDLLPENARVMVVLDSDHTHEHVLKELQLYAPLVTPGMFLIVADTVVEELPAQLHRPRSWGPGDSPKTALDSFLLQSTDFQLDEYVSGKMLMSSSAAGYLRRS
jgi:cephalosporin hydroxylase